MQSLRALDLDHCLELSLLSLNLTEVFPDICAELDRVLLLQNKCLPVIRPCLLGERSQRIATTFQLRELRTTELLEQLSTLNSTLQIPVGHFLDVGVRDGIDQT